MKWSIPGVGVVHPCIDRVAIVSPFKVGRLKTRLPVPALKQISHAFDVNSPTSKANPHVRSKVLVTGGRTLGPLLLLKQYEHELGKYSVVSAELAFDFAGGSSIDDAHRRLMTLVKLVGKFRHQRGFVRSEDKPHKKPPPGCVPEPTFYFENRKAGVNIKSYIRHDKLPGGGFGELIVRLEWTLNGKSALVRHLGGNKIDDLLRADLIKFLRHNLRLERVNHLTVGKVFLGHPLGTGRTANAPPVRTTIREQWADPDYWTERCGHLILRVLAGRQLDRGHFASWEDALEVCQNSPAQIRGYLRELRDPKRRKPRGRPRLKLKKQKRAITDYRIDACFRPVRLRPLLSV